MTVPTSALLHLYGRLFESAEPQDRARLGSTVIVDVDDVELLWENTTGELSWGAWQPPYERTLYVTRERWFILVPGEGSFESPGRAGLDAGATLVAAGGWNAASGEVRSFDPTTLPGEAWRIVARDLAGMANALMSCRNVSVETRKPPRQYRRHAQKTHPLTEWKVLNLFAKERAQAHRAVAGEVCPRRYHTVRGHLKHTRWGDFWWHPFWRGRPELGVITKDYRVLAAASESLV